MSSIQFPITCLYTWPSNAEPGIESVSRISSKLAALSQNVRGREWEVTVVLKRAKRNSALLDGSDKSIKRKDEESALLFVRFPDCGKCCVLPRTKINELTLSQRSIADVLVGDDNIESILSSDSIIRSTWKISGSRFLIGDFAIGVGRNDHGADLPTAVLEISYLPVCEDMKHVLALINQLARDIVSPTDPSLMKCVADSTLSSATEFTISHRALQWAYSVASC
eukprot:gene5765-11653_t